MEVMRHDPQVLGVLLRPELDYKAVQVPNRACGLSHFQVAGGHFQMSWPKRPPETVSNQIVDLVHSGGDPEGPFGRRARSRGDETRPASTGRASPPRTRLQGCPGIPASPPKWTKSTMWFETVSGGLLSHHIRKQTKMSQAACSIWSFREASRKWR